MDMRSLILDFETGAELGVLVESAMTGMPLVPRRDEIMLLPGGAQYIVRQVVYCYTGPDAGFDRVAVRVTEVGAYERMLDDNRRRAYSAVTGRHRAVR